MSQLRYAYHDEVNSGDEYMTTQCLARLGSTTNTTSNIPIVIPQSTPSARTRPQPSLNADHL